MYITKGRYSVQGDTLVKLVKIDPDGYDGQFPPTGDQEEVLFSPAATSILFLTNM